MKDICDKIIELLKNELPSEYHYKIEEFSKLNELTKYREAFMVLYELKKIDGWTPSNTLLDYYEKFWWKFAN